MGGRGTGPVADGGPGAGWPGTDPEQAQRPMVRGKYFSLRTSWTAQSTQ
jgi:hypothetical protein